MSVAESEPVIDGMEVTVNRVTYATQTVTEDIPFETKVIETADLYKGETQVQTAGVNGTKTAVKECKFVNGQLVESTDVVVLSRNCTCSGSKVGRYKSKTCSSNFCI